MISDPNTRQSREIFDIDWRLAVALLDRSDLPAGVSDSDVLESLVALLKSLNTGLRRGFAVCG
jgi:hypothetical protein